jgi:hypothetical protein
MGGTAYTFSLLPPAPDGLLVSAFGINDSGTIAGTAGPADGSNSVGFVLNGSTYTFFAHPSRTYTDVRGIGPTGIVAGVAEDVDELGNASNSIGFTYDPVSGVFTDIVVPGSSSVIAQGVNTAGTVVGNAFLVSGGFIAFIRDPNTGALSYFDLGPHPHGPRTRARGITDSGLMVGFTKDISVGLFGTFVGTPSSYQLLHRDLIGDTYGEGINDLGQVVGLMDYGDGFTHGFFASPLRSCSASTSIGSNFNGTRIAEGDSIWFNSNLSVSGLGSAPVTINFTSQSVKSGDFVSPLPDSSVTFDPTATTASTTFANGTWTTRVPASGLAGNTFLSGGSLLAPAGGFPGGINPVTWKGIVSTDAPGITIKWKWGAAVYTAFAGDPSQLGVKPVDDNHASQYQNSDHAGTPENFKSLVTGGARGGGGSNYTGSWSGTASVVPACAQ